MRQDFITVRMESFARTLATLSDLKKEGRSGRVIQIIGANLEALLGVGPIEFRKLSEIGLVSQLIKNGPMATVWFPYKQVMLIALLKELGDFATTSASPRGGWGWYLTALHLLLDGAAQGELGDYSELAPTVTDLLAALGDEPLPHETRVRLIREMERKQLPKDDLDRIKSALLK